MTADPDGDLSQLEADIAALFGHCEPAWRPVRRRAVHNLPDFSDWNPMTTQPDEADASAQLRERIAEAIRQATCEGDCGQTEEECAKQRIQPFVWHFGVLAEVSGPVDVIAAAVLTVVQPLLAAERAAGREAGIREGAEAIQDVIDRDRAKFPARSDGRTAAAGAREILLKLLERPTAEGPEEASSR